MLCSFRDSENDMDNNDSSSPPELALTLVCLEILNCNYLVKSFELMYYSMGIFMRFKMGVLDRQVE